MNTELGNIKARIGRYPTTGFLPTKNGGEVFDPNRDLELVFEELDRVIAELDKYRKEGK